METKFCFVYISSVVLYRCGSKENSLPVELVETSKSGIVRNFQLAAVN